MKPSFHLIWILGLLAVSGGFWWTKSHLQIQQHDLKELGDTCPNCQTLGHAKAWGGHDSLDWLVTEFSLSDAELQGIRELHLSFIPECQKRCEIMEEALTEFRTALAQANEPKSELSEEAEAALKRYTKAFEDCQMKAVQHVMKTAALMQPEAAERYREQVFSVLLPLHVDHHSMHQP